ncbi:histone acetyltransferase [Coemansia sp. RSA 1085]|nr:histone acetyltransferase [Coemansia sp. RSA 1085]
MSTYGEKYESRQNATRENENQNNNRKRTRSESEEADDGEIKDEDNIEDQSKEDADISTGIEEKTAAVEQQQGLIHFEVVYNDGEDVSMRRLTELKNIFQKQLPKMPKEYIARLVYDRNHSSLAIVKANGHVVGGITFRLFEQRQFAEIVFCAVSSSEQVKGFTKEITLDKRLWVGYIKDYEGGTLMQCSMVPKVEYLKVKEILAKQREAVLEKIQAKTKSQIVYPGLQCFKEDPGLVEIDPFQIPGIDLMTLETNVDENKYPTLDAFVHDTRKIFDNCKKYNGEGTRYWRCATSLEKFFNDKVKEWKSRSVK